MLALFSRAEMVWAVSGSRSGLQNSTFGGFPATAQKRQNGFMVLNLNMQATVTLTNAGRRRLIDFINDLQIPQPEEHCNVCFRGWRDGKMTTELWQLMQIFGKMMHHGSSPGPFERNEIEIPDAEFEWRAAAAKRELDSANAGNSKP